MFWFDTDRERGPLTLAMDADKYQRVEARLLFAMLRARKQYQRAMRNVDDSRTPRECVGEISELECVWKKALIDLHNFVLTEAIPQGFKVNEEEASSDPEGKRTSFEESLNEQIGIDMLSSFLGSQPIPDRRKNRRLEPRIDAQASPALLSDGEQVRIPVTILNVSKTGIGVSSETKLRIDDNVLIELNNDYKVVGTVRYCREDTSGARYAVGIRISRFMISGACDSWQDALISAP